MCLQLNHTAPWKNHYTNTITRKHTHTYGERFGRHFHFLSRCRLARVENAIFLGGKTCEALHRAWYIQQSGQGQKQSHHTHTHTYTLELRGTLQPSSITYAARFDIVTEMEPSEICRTPRYDGCWCPSAEASSSIHFFLPAGFTCTSCVRHQKGH